ncbi:pyridoxine/pyridoxamine 5'-phosphate oxidase [Kordiimonas sediminis]|uniref:Pyridoxine/pyridoxamine 5'-phosphate oxidase n=1 Tax=Kordiimonas sediminis TaxID=1735581 RepID=A0A919E9Q6_9PROT|nr:pyridoxamine 5'-phosphate oxidase [Kordiimonas sediminis]GHF26701.1 pyridoxine/pyridoxamine 5'-phosphate oxidase [Kordiimonas sediminis]
MTEKLVPHAEPYTRFGEWLKEAEKSELNDPTGMALATSTSDGFPSLRMVLMKGYDENGFVFYTNLGSRKAKELIENPKASILFHWKSLRRQVRAEGVVTPVTEAEADEYFQQRPRTSRIGAWASKQSTPMAERFEFEAKIAKFTAEFGIGDIPRPDFWSGFRIQPKRFEFWTDKKFRLHERLQYDQKDGGWSVSTLYP